MDRNCSVRHCPLSAAGGHDVCANHERDPQYPVQTPIDHNWGHLAQVIYEKDCEIYRLKNYPVTVATPLKSPSDPVCLECGVYYTTGPKCYNCCHREDPAFMETALKTKKTQAVQAQWSAWLAVMRPCHTCGTKLSELTQFTTCGTCRLKQLNTTKRTICGHYPDAHLCISCGWRGKCLSDVCGDERNETTDYCDIHAPRKKTRVEEKPVSRFETCRGCGSAADTGGGMCYACRYT